MHVAVAGEIGTSTAPTLAERLGIKERVHFLGKTTRVADLMRSVDLFVFPSRYEAHPLVVLEAMASELPIILSGGIELTREYPDCFVELKNPEDAEELAQHIRELLADEKRRRSLAQAARTQAVALQWANTTAAYKALYERLAAGEQSDAH